MTLPTLWSSDDVSKATSARSTQKWKATGVTIDSRNIQPGDLFVALKGPNHDGHDYVVKAIADGASAALVLDEWPYATQEDLPLIAVKDTYRALEQLGEFRRAQTTAKIVGITGSVGKTGSKEALAGALARFGETHKTEGNLNNHIGLPLSLARLPKDADFGVLEMGMNHSGEIDNLSRMGRPDVAIITTVDAVHLEFFDGVEGIAQAKSEIFNGMAPTGTAVLPIDNEWFPLLRDRAAAANVGRVITFGTHSDADIRLIDASLHAKCSAASVAMNGMTLDFCVGAPGKHWVLNCLGVLAATKALGLDPAQAAASFSDLRPSRGRGAFRRLSLNDGGTIGLIDESYNASPASVAAAMAVLGQSVPEGSGRRIAVLGDMRELGDASDRLHANLMDAIDAAKIDLVFCCGVHMRALWEVLPDSQKGAYAAKSEDLASPLTKALSHGDVVTVKGSLGTNMAPIIRALDALGKHDQSKDPTGEAA